jgi:hypothetical protein
MRATFRVSAGLAVLLAVNCSGTGGGDPAETGASVLAADPGAATTLPADFEALAFVRSDALARMAAPVIVNVAPSTAAASSRESALVAGLVEDLRAGSRIAIAISEESMFTALDAGQARSAILVTFIEPDAIPSLRTQLAGTGVPGSLVAELTSSLTGSGCAALEFADGGRPGVILINVNTALDAGRQTHCVAREIASNLGLPGRLSRSDSVFSSTAPTAGFGARDLVLMRMLYDPRLRSGMSAAAAKPLLPAVAADALAP